MGRGASVARVAHEEALLERAPFVELLDDALAAAESGGRLVLVGGEAGVGKTALLRHFCARHHATRCLWGACDALFTPRAHGPLLAVAERVGGDVQDLVARGGRPHDVVAALLEELRRDSPSLLVLEDMHWADEATLDVVRILGRRIEGAPALVVATFREDELDPVHPLRIVLGELATRPGVKRVSLPPLTEDAVRTLATPHGVDAVELHRITGGNPFFVTEVLASSAELLPATVRDAVLGRAARLEPAARAILEAVAIATPHAELWLLEELSDDLGPLDECLASGMLVPEDGAVRFRHELARLAVETSIAPHRARTLHAAAIRALTAEGVPLDAARVVHHADAAGDAPAVLHYAPIAGERATAAASHREAAAQWARAVRFSEGAPPEVRAHLLESLSYACYLSEDHAQSLAAREEAVALRRTLADPLREGDSLRWLSRLLWCVGRVQEAEPIGHEAVRMLEPLGPSQELARAYGVVCGQLLAADDNRAALPWAEKQAELAERLGADDILAIGLANIGCAQVQLGIPGGEEALDRGIEIARRGGHWEQLVAAESNAGIALLEVRAYESAERHMLAVIAFLHEFDAPYWQGYPLATLARSRAEQGDWAGAVETAEVALARPRILPLARVLALAVLGGVRARRGEGDVWGPLDEALELAAPTQELQQVTPVGIARAEAALLAGDPLRAQSETEAAFALASRGRNAWVLGHLAVLRRRAGIEEPAPSGVAEPYALELAGRWVEAAARWDELGCPYEAALALADSGDEQSLRDALARLQRLGAAPAAAAVAQKLGLRGPRASTLEHPSGLTQREAEVLALLADGLRNAEIADRLTLSTRTVDHHVSAILRKLGVRTRVEAVRLKMGNAPPQT